MGGEKLTVAKHLSRKLKDLQVYLFLWKDLMQSITSELAS